MLVIIHVHNSSIIVRAAISCDLLRGVYNGTHNSKQVPSHPKSIPVVAGDHSRLKTQYRAVLIPQSRVPRMATAAITPGERPVGHGECEFLSPRENNGEQRGLRSSPRAGSESSGSGAGVNKMPSNFMERVQARVRSDAATADYRADIVRSIFGEVGTPVEGGWASVCCVLLQIDEFR